jgi:hypothetical protein
MIAVSARSFALYSTDSGARNLSRNRNHHGLTRAQSGVYQSRVHPRHTQHSLHVALPYLDDQTLTSPSSPTSLPMHVLSARPTSPGTSANTTAVAVAMSSVLPTSQIPCHSTRTPATTPTAPKAKPATPASAPGALSRSFATHALPALLSQ